MKRAVCRFGLGFSLLGLLMAVPLVSAKEEHPAMHDASEALHAALTSADPIEDLQKARRSLETAKANKMGQRADAIKLIDKAIATLKANDRIEADKLIKEASLLIEKGIELHPRDGKRK